MHSHAITHPHTAQELHRRCITHQRARVELDQRAVERRKRVVFVGAVWRAQELQMESASVQALRLEQLGKLFTRGLVGLGSCLLYTSDAADE